jgi:hypothetical protein
MLWFISFLRLYSVFLLVLHDRTMEKNLRRSPVQCGQRPSFISNIQRKTFYFLTFISKIIPEVISEQVLQNVLINLINRFIAFTLSSNFKAFLVTDVDDFDMMH